MRFVLRQARVLRDHALGGDHVELPDPAPHARQPGAGDDGPLPRAHQPAGAARARDRVRRQHAREPAQRVLHVPRQHRPRALRRLAHLLPATRSTHEVLQALPWTLALVGVTTILAFVLGHAHRARRRLAARRDARRRPAADLRDHVRVPVLLAGAALDLAVRDQARLAARRAAATTSPTTVGWSWGFAGDAIHHSILPAFTILITSIGALDPDDAQQHDLGADRGLRAHGAGERAAARGG